MQRLSRKELTRIYAFRKRLLFGSDSVVASLLRVTAIAAKQTLLNETRTT